MPAPLPDPTDLSALAYAYVELTVTCNLRCHFCDNGMRNRYRDLPPERFRAIVDQLAPGTRLGLHGLGEPTLHRDLVDLVAHAKERGLYVYFNSNHTVTTEAQMEGLVAVGLDELRISLSAGTAEGFAAYAGRDLFDALIARIRRMVELRGERPRPLLRLVFVLTAESAPHVPRVAALADDLGVDELQLQTLLDWGDPEGLDAAPVPEADQERLRDLVLQAAAGVRRVRLILPFLGETSSEPEAPGQCQWPFNATWITADGRVTPCCNLHDPDEISLGDAFEEPLEQIWLGPRYVAFRERYRRGEVAACQTCPIHFGRFKSYTYESG